MSSSVAARPVAGDAAAAPAGQPGPLPRLAHLLGRHWLLAALLTLGIALRVVTMLAYPPALLYIDSYRYLYNLTPLNPDLLDPIGYDLILKPLLALGGLQFVVIVQHLLGIGIALAVYALARRHGVRNWLAALATAPTLLDAYQVQIEQNIMSDPWLQALIVLMLWLLVRRGAPGPVRTGVVGVLLALAVVVRTIALPLALPIVAYLLVTGGAWRDRAGWRQIGRRAGALAVCFGLVLFCYAGYFHRETGRWGLSGSSDSVLYGRTADIADCSRLDLDPTLQELCPAEPLGARKGVDWYAHLDGDPGWPGPVPPGETVQNLQHQFALRVIEKQPLDVARAILADFGKGFAPGRDSDPDDVPVQRWQFQSFYPIWTSRAEAVYYTQKFDGGNPGVRAGLATFLRDYQLGGGYTPGPALALCAVLGLVGGFWRRRSGIRSATLLVTTLALVILFASAMFEFSWRYQLPGLVLLPLAGVLGLTGLLGPLRRPEPRRRRPLLAPFPDRADWAALHEFTARYGQRRFPPVLVLIAAHDERDGIGAVLDGLPARCCGLDVGVLVLADGCTDDTAEVAREHGALVCESAVNRGQGAALRLGYRLAGYGGARYVVTTDADGQYDNAELPLLLGPLVEGEADFVTGSRRLGVAPGDDRVRGLGVRVFARLASLLTGRRVTDTSFGFRAMRTELAGAVRLRQPQYQAAELLLSVLAGGARVLERPMTMRVRSAGTTKKGGNLVYGANYARVMLRTWSREYLLRRRSGAVRPASPSGDPARRT